MANKTRSLILVISTLSACLLSASERDQEDIKYVKPFFAVAHAAGSIHKCGVSEEVGDQILKKIINASTCGYQSGKMGKADGMAMGETLIKVFFESRKKADINPPTTEMCDAGKYLIGTIMKADQC